MARHSGFTRSVELYAFVAAFAVVLAVGASALTGNEQDAPAADARAGAADREGRDPPGTRTAKESDPEDRRMKAGAPPAPRLYYVARVVDGDTVELGNGQTVRLVGIDTPEVGECGHEAAADSLAGLVLGRDVRLSVSDEDRDQYGRLLRYVDIGTMDAGLRLIKRGLAVARYDSRDGYGYHPRQNLYVAIDAATKDISCPKPVPLVGPRGGSCAAGYSPCTRPYPPDLDCADVDGPIQVSGSDPHGLDADGDGAACE